MRNLRRSLLAVMVFLGTPQVLAQAPSDPDKSVRQLLGLALDNIQRGVCESGKPCAPATAEERADPPLTVDEARSVVSRAVLSAMGEHCGLDWQRLNYLPMMTHWRNALQSSERKMTLIALLHGITQGQISPVLAKRGPCTDAVRRDLEARLAFRA